VEQVSSREVYRNAWMSVREDVVRWPDGSQSVYGVVDKADFAVVLPRGDGGFWMVEQFRYPVARRSWEFPMGGWPAGRDGSALELGRLELSEETGLGDGTWRHLGRLEQANGYSSQGFDVFLATDLVPGAPRREATEQDMVHRFVEDAELHAMIRSGAVADATSLAALSLFRIHHG